MSRLHLTIKPFSLSTNMSEFAIRSIQFSKVRYVNAMFFQAKAHFDWLGNFFRFIFCCCTRINTYKPMKGDCFQRASFTDYGVYHESALS